MKHFFQKNLQILTSNRPGSAPGSSFLIHGFHLLRPLLYPCQFILFHHYKAIQVSLVEAIKRNIPSLSIVLLLEFSFKWLKKVLVERGVVLRGEVGDGDESYGTSKEELEHSSHFWQK